jgi:hypothetical protein
MSSRVLHDDRPDPLALPHRRVRDGDLTPVIRPIVALEQNRMSGITNWLFDTKHPLRFALVCLLIGLGNVYEATHIDNPNGLMYVVSWIFAAGGLIGFVAFLLIAVSEHFSKRNGGQ